MRPSNPVRGYLLKQKWRHDRECNASVSTKPFVATRNDGISIPFHRVHPHRTCRLRSVYN